MNQQCALKPENQNKDLHTNKKEESFPNLNAFTGRCVASGRIYGRSDRRRHYRATHTVYRIGRCSRTFAERIIFEGVHLS
ncbi:hypothetical protein KIN20_035467 [Parelaphostrongylus tenuis]|uniref:Uncharacterized protein n=1 Tax=Parelaphostrongylus tenuis TaxID=148309 RepID=A0AAD5WJZ0_PARTN|nr:hypothetical protein KIN20_035467 [Parelaphostrongylus tenuis]